MPDSRSRDPMPRDWREAFGALPQEVPPAGSWQRLAAALPAAHAQGRTRWRRPALVVAAAMLLVAIAPWMSSRLVQTELPADASDRRHAATASTPPSAPAVPTVAVDDVPVSPVRVADAPVPAPTAEEPAAPARRAIAGMPRQARLDALYDESARLEALLAQLPDSGAANAASLAIATDLQDQVAHIDLALSQPALSRAARTALWEERVDTLRQLTGVEATQRWNVAFGDIAHVDATTIY